MIIKLSKLKTSLFILIFCISSYSQYLYDFPIGTNYRLYPSTISQTEAMVTVHPLNPSIIFSSANTVNFLPTLFISEGIYVTTNSGNSWYGSDTCKGANIQFHGGDPGIAIDKNGTFILTRLGRDPFTGLYSHFSNDNGLSWSTGKTITTDDLERAVVVSDGFSASTFFGRTYAFWVELSPPYAINFTKTDNGAQNWSTPSQINNPSQRSAGGDAAIYKNGKVYVCWAGVTSSSPFTEILVGFASSTDGGLSWVVDENAFNTNGIQGILPEKQNVRVNGYPRIAVDKSGGSRDGWIYIVTTQKNLAPAGSDPDIILNYSTDGGVTWSQSIRVNQDAVNNGNIQYFPAIHVDNTGAVNIIYYDDRNTTSDSSGVFLSRSVDGGNTWTEYEISDHNFKPTPIGGLGQGYQGDNIAITSANNTLWPIWMDNSTGVYQLWTVPIPISEINVEELNQNTVQDFELYQNYPNPFNGETKIRFRVREAGYVFLSVFDLLGNEVMKIKDGFKPAGTYEISFNSGELPTGIYFYKLTAGNFSEVKKMVLMK
ncbi:MAG: T9SS type A sorting domain-containing protein [Ignavibacteriaceae bacterium]|nr:T9SS type A sorting domain-containing protein [Ignavibacteriaceae bacterium]